MKNTYTYDLEFKERCVNVSDDDFRASQNHFQQYVIHERVINMSFYKEQNASYVIQVKTSSLWGSKLSKLSLHVLIQRVCSI